MNTDDREPNATRKPTPEEQRWFDYAFDLPFTSNDYLTKFADRLLSLGTALVAAYIAGLKLSESMTVRWYTWTPALLFLVAVLLSLLSLYPRRVRERTTDLDELRRKYFDGLNRRHRLLKAGFILFFVGLATAVAVFVLS